MPKLPKYNSTKLFHKLAREYKEEWIKENGRKPTLAEWNQIQKWTSKNLYQDFKGRSFRSVKVEEVKKEITFKTTKPKERKCYDVRRYDLASYLAIDWWNIWNTVIGFEPNTLIRVNGGAEFGKTSIKHAGDFNKEEVLDIENAIREFTENASGDITFMAVIRPVPKRGKPKLSNPCDWFLDLTLSDAEGLIEPVEDVPFKQMADFEEISEEQLRLKRAERKRSREQRERQEKAKKRKRPKEVSKAKAPARKKADVKEIRSLIADLRQDVKDGLITKKFYQKEVAKLTAKLEKGGIT